MLYYLLRLLVVAVVLLPVYIPARLLYRRSQKRRNQTDKSGPAREMVLAVFVLFVAGLLALVWWPTRYHMPVGERLRTGWHINLVPLHNLRYFFAEYGTHDFVINVIGNVLMFVPMGFCLPLLWQRWQKFWKVLAVAVLFPVCIESVQLFVDRTVDVDDVLLNALGIVLGYGAWRLCSKMIPKIRQLAADKSNAGKV